MYDRATKAGRLERRNKRMTVALTMTVVAMAAVVTMAATGEKYSNFDTVVARSIYVKNAAGEVVISLGENDGGDGLVRTISAKGKDLVGLTSSPSGGNISTYHPNGKELVELGATNIGGAITTYQANGKELVAMSTSDNGGAVWVSNKTGENIVELRADDYGNGYIGAWNRKGKGRTLQPGR